MKKQIITLVAVAVLAGCSASASAAQAPTVNVASYKAPTSVLNLLQDPQPQTLLGKQNAAVMSVLAQQARMDKVISRVEARIGKTWYVFSGDQPTGWDCSGLTRWAYAQMGIDIPHSATKQAGVGRLVEDPLPGDIVLFGYKGSKSYYHAALYVGNGKVVHAGFRRGTTTQIISISSPAFRGSRVSYVRVLDTTPIIP